jgi:hypothetical protein
MHERIMFFGYVRKDVKMAVVYFEVLSSKKPPEDQLMLAYIQLFFK